MDATNRLIITGQPIPYHEWARYYKSVKNYDWVQELTKNSFALHYWNRMRKVSKIDLVLNEEQLLYKIFKANCPYTEQHLLKKLVGIPY